VAVSLLRVHYPQTTLSRGHRLPALQAGAKPEFFLIYATQNTACAKRWRRARVLQTLKKSLRLRQNTNTNTVMCDNESNTQWRRFVAGDNTAYDWLYNKYIRSLYRYGLHFTADGEAVKDCIHDIFTSLYRNRRNLVVPANVKVYLFVSLKNSLLRYLQNKSIYGREEVEEAPFLLEPTVEDEYIDNEQFVRRKEMIRRMLSVISPRQKEIIYYRFIQELQWDKICTLMNLSYQSAQNLLQRAIRKIRDNFDLRDDDLHRP
jgi:RNA polymerase sigma factor (sigma-70 family)